MEALKLATEIKQGAADLEQEDHKNDSKEK